MKLIRFLCVHVSILISCSAFSEVVEVYTWKAFPGKNSEMIAVFTEAKKLHEEAGASVAIVQRGVGSTQEVDYVMRWDDPSSWGKSMDNALGSSRMTKKWQAFLAKANLDPAGEMVSSLSGWNLDSSKKAADFNGSFVYGAWVWDVTPGRNADFIESASRAKAIHEALGARVEIYQEGVGGTNRMHYLMIWEGYAAWAKTITKLGTSEAWADHLARRDHTAATLVASHRGQTVVAH